MGGTISQDVPLPPKLWATIQDPMTLRFASDSKVDSGIKKLDWEHRAHGNAERWLIQVHAPDQFLEVG